MRYLSPQIAPAIFVLAIASFLGCFSARPAMGSDADVLTYNQHIRPILADKCFACHGADSATREAGLRLDIRDEAVGAGAIEPGLAEASEMISRIYLADDDDGLMPPTSSHKQLSGEEKKTLSRWIDGGAVYQPHWAFIAPERASLPEVTSDSHWIRNPIDRFVLARMQANGLSPAPDADRQTLARRVALDITGLPPLPEWVDTFMSDESADAYEKYIDRLMAEPTWGEHRARYWLDYARYADTHGIHFDNYREIWAYRDWVISAFNDNQPYDQFSIEQLAGDLLDAPTLEQQIATGFHRCNMTTNEGGIIDEEYAVLYARDRTETTAAVWLGLTVGCAVCHDHKFDPVSAKEFYSLSAFFNNTTQAVRDGNVSNTPPVIEVPIAEDRERVGELLEAISTHEANLSAIRNRTKAELSTLPIVASEVAAGLPMQNQLVLHAPLGEGVGNTTNVLFAGQLHPVSAKGTVLWNDGYTQTKAFAGANEALFVIDDAGDFEFKDPFTAAVWVYPQSRKLSGAIVARMDESQKHRGWDLWFDNGRVATHIIHDWPENAIKIAAGDALPVNQWSHVAVVNDGLGKADGVHLYVNGIEQTNRQILNETLEAKTIRTEVPLTILRRTPGAKNTDARVNDLRLYTAALSEADVALLAVNTPALFAASIQSESRTEEQNNLLVDWYLNHKQEAFLRQSKELEGLKREREAIRSRGTIAHVMNEKPQPAVAYVLKRGEYDQRGEQVGPDVPAALPRLGDRPRNRLGLAQWMFTKENPLVSRVTVNRFWQEVFGTGLVRTSADFGVMGELPSHPELLDYLAIEFRESGWNVKDLFRMMLSSSTYRQSARVSEAGRAIDMENRLLAQGPRFRMDAEMLRDMALWSSGQLSTKIGGPSVRPYQPAGVWEAVAMPGSSTRNYVTDKGESLYRRSMYTFWKRAAPPASMEILGAPNREVCTIQRERTNTPLQALVTLNDPQFVEAAKKLAEKTLLENESDESRLQSIASQLLSRPFKPNELTILNSGLEKLRGHYEQNQEDAEALLSVGESAVTGSLSKSELAAWTMLASEIFNLDETLCK
ncbi:Planctomycete cytochrome C [Planctomycetes bacterium CA13]|uniref:Planctomycete cytochrome C n=1 Tax=Novipirellula herctigrandis TaxID=2527986 RepID=A0A5C5YN50_9BACT|nr:Planctomycete cytochrome C [Planctomycetes bacterium CA13]